MQNGKYFYVSDGTNKIGPLSAQDIWKLINKNRVGLLDMIFDTRLNKWLSIVNHEEFSEEEVVDANSVADAVNVYNHDEDQPLGLIPDSAVALNLETGKGSTPPLLKQQRGPLLEKRTAASAADTWYIQKDQHTMGPYSFLQIASLLQNGQLKFGDALKSKDDVWKKVEDVFSIEEVNAFDLQIVRQHSMIRSPVDTTRRKDLRKDISNTLFISDSRLQYIVQGLDVTANGIAFLSNAPHFSVGQPLSCSFVDRTNQLVRLQGHVLRQDSLENEEAASLFYRFILRFEKSLDEATMLKFQS